MNKVLNYEIGVSYEDKKEGIDYTLEAREMFFSDMLTSALRDTERLNEIKHTNIEKKALSILKNEKITSLTIDIEVKGDSFNREKFLMYRYCLSYGDIRKLCYDEKNPSTLIEEYQTNDLKEVVRDMKLDFQRCKDFLKEEINKWIIEKLDN